MVVVDFSGEWHSMEKAKRQAQDTSNAAAE
jgi:hypothetical protein